MAQITKDELCSLLMAFYFYTFSNFGENVYPCHLIKNNWKFY